MIVKDVEAKEEGWQLEILTEEQGYLYIKYVGLGSDLNYKFYGNDKTTEITDKETIKELTEAIVRYKAQVNQGILYISEYGSYIFSRANQNCNVFVANIGLTDDDIIDFKNEFQKTNTANKNFFSIVLNSDEHVSTLIVDCREKQNVLYLFDTSENVHQLENKKGVDENIIKSKYPICCLNSIKEKSLQGEECCSTWVAIMNYQIAQKTNIEEVINTQHNCLNPLFFQNVIKGVTEIDKEFLNLENCDELMTNIKEQIILEPQVREEILIPQEEDQTSNPLIPRKLETARDLPIPRNLKAARQQESLTDTQVEEQTQQIISSQNQKDINTTGLLENLRNCSSVSNEKVIRDDVNVELIIISATDLKDVNTPEQEQELSS